MKIKRNQNGFILIEVLLSVVVISIGLTLIVSSLLNSYRVHILNADYAKVLIALDSQLSSLTQSRFMPIEFKDGETFSDPLSRYSYSIGIHKISTGNPPLNELEFKAFWPSGKNNSQVSFSSFLFEAPHE